MSVGGHAARGELLLEQRRYDLAESEFRAALAQDPQDARLHILLALTLVELHREREAMQEARTAIGLAPDEPGGHFALGFALANEERFRDARRALDEAIRLDPRNPSYWGTLARTWIGERRWTTAVEAADQGLAIEPSHGPCLNMRSIALTQLGRLDEAAATIGTALQHNPESSAAHANRGFAALHRGRAGEALDAFTESLRLDPENEGARSGFAEALKAQNPIYAALLRFSLWTARLGTGPRLVLLFGAPFIFRVVRNLAQTDDGMAAWFYPFAALYFSLILLTWLGDPVFNLLLRFHPVGRHALSREQVVETNLVGGSLLIALVSAALALVTGNSVWWIGAVGGVLVALPLSSIYGVRRGWPRLVLTGFAVAVAGIGAGAILIGLTSADREDPLEAALPLAVVGLLVGVISTWVATALRATRGR